MKDFESCRNCDLEAAVEAFAFHFAVMWDQNCEEFDAADPDERMRGVRRLFWSSPETRDAWGIFTHHLTEEEKLVVLGEVCGHLLDGSEPTLHLSE